MAKVIKDGDKSDEQLGEPKGSDGEFNNCNTGPTEKETTEKQPAVKTDFIARSVTSIQPKQIIYPNI